jgi:hypothetical protein
MTTGEWECVNDDPCFDDLEMQDWRESMRTFLSEEEEE